MSAPKYCECGRRIVVRSAFRARRKKWQVMPTIKGHDLCRDCFDKLVKRRSA